jgi:hypothetical protein
MKISRISGRVLATNCRGSAKKALTFLRLRQWW